MEILFLICAGIVMFYIILEPWIYREKEFDIIKFLGWLCAFIWCLNAMQYN